MTLSAARNWLLVFACLCLSGVNAQRWRGDDNDGSDQGNPWWFFGNGGSNGGGSNSNNPFASQLGYYSSDSGRRALIAHAVIASAVWVILVPLGGILLRLNIRSPWVLRVHATLQILSYLLYIAAVGLGIYLINTMTSFDGYTVLWSSSHPRLGMAILGLATFQPILGAIHHRLFKKRVEKMKAGKSGPAPGRTIPGHLHLWLGRFLIVLGIVNGGLGIQLAGRTPFQSDQSTRTAGIVYGVVAGIMFLAYLIIVVLFEKNKAQRDREFQNNRAATTPLEDVPPTYAESQETLQKPEAGATRYS